MPTVSTSVTSSWTPPATITGVSATAQEEFAYIELDWTASSTANFTHYRIYRRELGGSGIWDILADINNQSIVQYLDVTAGQTIVYEYMITQFISVTGDVDLESNDSDIITAALLTDTWFIIADFAGLYSTIEVITTDETHTAVLQQEVFEPLASKHKRVVRGNALGNEGSITGLFDVSIARESKEFFEQVNQTGGPHVLKSPFGDVWQVEFDAPSYKYQTGGHLQVTIGWVEVE